MARPTIFSEELADAICERLASGESLVRICGGDDFPSETTVYRWLQTDLAFRDKYAKAREVQAERMADEILEIADDASNDWMTRFANGGGEAPGWTLNGEHVQRSRLRIDSRKWLMSKMLPKKYGDKLTQEVTGSEGGPVQITRVERVIVRGNATD
jgi:hypothetical protein